MVVLTFIRDYIYNMLIAIDQLLNAVMFGDPDESISERVGRRWPESWVARIINGLFFWQKNHVMESLEGDEGKDDLIK